jgi:hypothetical protein
MRPCGWITIEHTPVGVSDQRASKGKAPGRSPRAHWIGGGASVLPNPPHLMPREGIQASLEAVESLVKAWRKPPHFALGGGREGDLPVDSHSTHTPTYLPSQGNCRCLAQDPAKDEMVCTVDLQEDR